MILLLRLSCSSTSIVRARHVCAVARSVSLGRRARRTHLSCARHHGHPSERRHASLPTLQCLLAEYVNLRHRRTPVLPLTQRVPRRSETWGAVPHASLALGRRTKLMICIGDACCTVQIGLRRRPKPLQLWSCCGHHHGEIMRSAVYSTAIPWTLHRDNLRSSSRSLPQVGLALARALSRMCTNQTLPIYYSVCHLPKHDGHRPPSRSPSVQASAETRS